MFNFNTLIISLILLLYYFKTSNSLPQVVTEGAGDSALPELEALSVGDSVNGSPVDSNTHRIPHSVEGIPDFGDSGSATDVSAESAPELGDSVLTETLPVSSSVYVEAIPDSGMNIVTEIMPESDAIDSHSDAPPELDDTGANTDVVHESGHSIHTEAVLDMSASGADGIHEAHETVDSGPAADAVGSVNSELQVGSGGSSSKLLPQDKPVLTESSKQRSDAGNGFNPVHLSDPVDSGSAELHVVSGDGSNEIPHEDIDFGNEANTAGSNDNDDAAVPPNSNSVIISDSPPETEFEALSGQSTEAIPETIDNSGSHTEIIGSDNNAIADIETISDGNGAAQEHTEMLVDSDAHESAPQSIDEDSSGTDFVHSVAGNGQEFDDHIDSIDSTHSFDGTDNSDGSQSMDESGDTEIHESSDFTEDIGGSDGGFVAGTVDPKANTIGDNEEVADSTEDITGADAVTEPFGGSDLANTNGSKGCTKADNGSTTTGPDATTVAQTSNDTTTTATIVKTTTALGITSGPPASAVGNVLFKEALLVPKRERRIIARYKVIIPVIIPQVRVRVPFNSNANNVESSSEVRSSSKRKKSRKSRKSRKKSRKSPAKSKKSRKSKTRSKRNASESSHSMKNSRPSSRSGSKSKPRSRFLFWKMKSKSKPSTRTASSSKKSLKPAKRSGKEKYQSKPAARNNSKSGSTPKPFARSQIFWKKG